MAILCAKPLGFSLLCLVIVFGVTHGYETASIAQPPCTALPPASAPVSIAQPPENTVFPPASAPTSIPEPPTTAIPPGIAQPPCTSGLPPASAPISIPEPPTTAIPPVSIAQPPENTVFPPASAPTGIPEPPTTAIPPGIAQPPCSSGLPPASAPISISEPPVTAIPPSIAQQPCSSVFPPASAPTSIAEPPSSTVLPPANAPLSTSEPPTAAIPTSIAQPPCSTVLPPASAPVQEAPSDMLIPPPKKLVAVQGMVYCKPCDNRGVEKLSGAAPLEGAVVKLQCKNTKYPLVVQTKTDKNGKFFIKAPNTVTTYGYHKCRVFLVDSPANNCNTPSNLNNGLQGAMLMRSSKPPGSAQAPVDFELFSVGPFAFGHKLPCPSWVH
ncbi:hypothetical protein DCAR_0209080 [Daucus carota subsp. sativus]|uniref:Pistil-specific extensin-like protein n=1 Tax=Daucus carota subsp. sativus TaxID=79200 RepID=A0A166F0I9_DAUCS|nr:PREDICTED: non-classical arabinogalactan protein 30-like [Daucus carota subsp. sativus]WOG89841.1 hypothetical protein DCAR_0209080 [Daucus carota subsp. sativus]